MATSRLSSVIRFAKGAVRPKILGAAAAGGLLTIHETTEDREDHHDGSRHSILRDAPRLDWFERTLTSFFFPQLSACEPRAVPMPRLRGLRRHRTIEQMEKTASKETLRSKYAVNWNEPLGEGSFGVVYSAKDRKTGEVVAVKKINKTLTDNATFQREMDALLHLRQAGGHPNICGMRENFDEGGYYYIVMDLVTGGEMFDKLCEKGAYSEADAARLVREISSALAFLHGIGIVHGDLKPENLMLSSPKDAEAVIKVVDFGCAQVRPEADLFGGKNSRPPQVSGSTPAYSPPEVLDTRKDSKNHGLDPSYDMWALGVIVYVMLTGVHPFDVYGTSTDEEIMRDIVSSKGPPLHSSDITAHLSSDAVKLIEKLLTMNPKKRATALELLEDPWVQGKTARTSKIADSHKRLKKYQKFKSRLEAKVFADMVALSDNVDIQEVARRTSLIERAFHNLDPDHKGFVSPDDLRELGEEGEELSLSGFSDLLSENMRNRYFPKGHVIYHEGDKGNDMYFLNSGSIEVYTKDGFSKQLRNSGDFFGEGALMRPDGTRSASIRCLTPVHAIQVSREYFEKYTASDSNVKLALREIDKTRKRQRAKQLLSLQKNMKSKEYSKNHLIFEEGQDSSELYIIEEGNVEISIKNIVVLSLKPGEMCGERALISGRPANVSARCVSNSCRLQVLPAKDFHALLDARPPLKESIRDICLRREVQKALCLATKRAFPKNEEELKKAFQAIDLDRSGVLNLKEIRQMIKRLDPSYTEQDVKDILDSLDLDESGNISWEEFKRIFGMEEANLAHT